MDHPKRCLLASSDPRWSQPANHLFANQTFEQICTSFQEFQDKIKTTKPSRVKLNSWVFQEVDFSPVDKQAWNQYSISGALFLGCVFPSWTTESQVFQRGGRVWDQFQVPFKAFRSTLYSQPEMLEHSEKIYQFYKKDRQFSTLLAESLHDFSLSDALSSYLCGRVPVGVMGGHRLLRACSEYSQLVMLCRSLAQKGFLIVTGGGPGAMEAANLGGYLANRTEAECVEALALIAERVGYTPESTIAEYLNPQPAINIIERFGLPERHIPSLGIPTFHYGHEPSNRFAGLHAKFFQNSIREDGLLQICEGGIIYVRGGAGTRQEIFQAACHNTYPSKPSATRPMVFLGKSYWEENGIWELLGKFAKPEPFSEYLLLSDSSEEIVHHLLNHAKAKGLQLIPSH